jgi:hypothetical protein
VAFPSGYEEYFSFSLSAVNLIGFEGVPGSVQNLLYREVFDFQPGDELHIRDYNSSFGEGQETRTIYRYLVRTDYPDSIVYSVQVDRDYYEIQLGGNLAQTGFLSEVQEQVIVSSPAFNQLPLSPVPLDYQDLLSSNYYTQSSGSPRQKSISGWHELFFDEWSGCWFEIIDGGCSNFFSGDFEYIENRGGPYYVCGTMFSPYGRELVYYNVDGQEGGTPFQLILNAETAAEKDFRVYPNPAIDVVYIETGQELTNTRIEISDVQGRVVFTETLAGSRSEIEVGSLPAGVFIYRLYADEAVLKTGKILVQR